MVIHVRGKNVSLENGIQEYAETELKKLNKYSTNDLISASVSFTGKASRSPERSSRAEIVLFAPGHSFHSEENGNALETAFDAALDKLKHQLKKLKSKREAKSHQHPGLAEIVNATLEESAPAEAQEERQALVVEKFNVKPMGVNEAVMRLDLAKRDFFIFYNGQNQVHAVYKRGDGSIGLLVPETELLD